MAEQPPKIHTPRPVWAKHLDRLGLMWSKISGRLVPRPDEKHLTELARNHRPPPEPMDFRPEDHGIEDHLTQGRASLQRGDFGEALHHFRAQIAREPEDNWAWHGRGDAFQMMEQSKEALAAYETASKIAPRVGIHLGGRANALQSLGRHEEAETIWKEALLLDPELTWMRSDAL